MRRVLSVFIAVCFVLSLFTSVFAPVPFARGETEGFWSYSLAGGNATITGYTGLGGAVVIPSTIGVGPYPVTRVGDGAFNSTQGHLLTSVSVPNGVTTIGSAAFYGCGALTSVTIPTSVTGLGGSAFCGCTALTSVTLPNSLTSIGPSVFQGCIGLTAVTIPDSVTAIGDYAFYSCTGLTSLTIGSGVTTIGDYAFQHCSALTGLIIPNSVTGVGAYAFSLCAKLTNVIIPNSVTSIGIHAFQLCTALTGVTIGSGVTSIGAYVFSACAKLASVTIPDTVTGIGEYAFQTCSALTAVTIGSGVTSIGNYGFYGCTDLTAAYFLGNAPTMGTGVFALCAAGLTVWHVDGTTGWTNPWYGYPTDTVYLLTYTPGPHGSIAGMLSQIVHYGANGTQVTAIPDTGYHFVQWSDGFLNDHRSDIAVDANVSVTATFAPTTVSYSLSLLPSWNVISVPFSTSVSLLPTCDFFLAWDGSFWQPVTTLFPGTGYLVRNTIGATAVTLSGTPSSSPQTQPATGTWQIIGNPYTTPASFTCTTSVPYLLWWDGSFWQSASLTNLPPGSGFLLQASSPGTITLTRLP
jgi:hypothetical protein